jgi:hypothetical protein
MTGEEAANEASLSASIEFNLNEQEREWLKQAEEAFNKCQYDCKHFLRFSFFFNCFSL